MNDAASPEHKPPMNLIRPGHNEPVNEQYAPSFIAADIDLVYTGCPGLLAITTLPDRNTKFFTVGKTADMATYIAVMAQTQNVYAAVATLGACPARGRGCAADTVALPGVVLDLDVAGPAHAEVAGRLPLPVDHQGAMSLVDSMPFGPTVIYNTGHGLLVRYLFTEPLTFNTSIERQAVSALAVRWNALAVDVGRAQGVHVDTVGDLARLTRIAGTWNRKAKPVRVEVVECHPQRRYRADELIDALPVLPSPRPVPLPEPRRHSPAHLDGKESPADAFSRLVTWAEILEPAGFTFMRGHGATSYWRHCSATSPKGTPSASTDHDGAPVLVVFSESAAATAGLPIGSGHRLTRFRVWAILNYRGDEAEAARALRAMARSQI